MKTLSRCDESYMYTSYSMAFKNGPDLIKGRYPKKKKKNEKTKKIFNESTTGRVGVIIPL